MNLTPELLAELEKVKDDFKQSQNEAVDALFANFILKIENQPLQQKQSPASTEDKYAQVLPGDLPVSEGSFPIYEPVIYLPDDMIQVDAGQKSQQQQSANKRLLEENMLKIKDEPLSGESKDGDEGTVAKKQKMSENSGSETVEEDGNESHDNDSFFDPETEVTMNNNDSGEYSEYEEEAVAAFVGKATGAVNQPGGLTKLPVQRTAFTMSITPPETRPFTPKEGAMASADSSKFNKFTILTLICPLDGCDMVIDNQGDMNKHTNAPHSVPQTCPANGCHQPFYISKDLSVHAELVHQRFTRWTCDHCERIFGNFSLLNTHKFLQHHQGTFCCTDSSCSYMGVTRFEMLRHFDSNHSISNNLALNPTLNSSSRNPPRQQVSLGQPRFATLFTVCIVPDCGAIFSNKNLFYDHLEHQHGILQFRCLAQYCYASFKERTDLDYHIQRCHRAVTLWGCPFDYCAEPPAGDCYSMHKHIYLCHHEGKFKCSNCHFTAHNRITILKHYELLHI